jgi:4'-phosphopantetheinyl transferase
VTWSSPPRDLTLESDEVHVWRAASDSTGLCLEDLRQTLSADERARAERFSFRLNRDRFIIRRGLLRAILGRYLAMDPGRLQFNRGAHGKPALAPQDSGMQLRFNVSRSAGLILYAVARGREIGVDLEQIQPAIARECIPEHFFSPREVAALRALPVDAQPEAFFTCWTRKEAYVKARGAGLALRLDGFDVSLVPGEPAALLRTAGDAQEASRWSLQALAPGRGYVGALAVEGHARQLSCWQWPEMTLSCEPCVASPAY